MAFGEGETTKKEVSKEEFAELADQLSDEQRVFFYNIIDFSKNTKDFYKNVDDSINTIGSRFKAFFTGKKQSADAE